MEKIDKKMKERVMDVVNKVNDTKVYETSWENGNYKFKKKINVEQGRVSRAQGGKFELKVRKDLEKKGYIVDKWTNNVDLDKGKLIISRKYNPFKKLFILGAGFPDFIATQHVHDGLYRLVGVEVKMNGTLSKEEKEKCGWYLQKEIFSVIWIAKKGEKRGEIEYINFQERYKNILQNNKD